MLQIVSKIEFDNFMNLFNLQKDFFSIFISKLCRRSEIKKQ